MDPVVLVKQTIMRVIFWLLDLNDILAFRF